MNSKYLYYWVTVQHKWVVRSCSRWRTVVMSQIAICWA